jgi:hypothetical protein
VTEKMISQEQLVLLATEPTPESVTELKSILDIGADLPLTKRELVSRVAAKCLLLDIPVQTAIPPDEFVDFMLVPMLDPVATSSGMVMDSEAFLRIKAPRLCPQTRIPLNSHAYRLHELRARIRAWVIANGDDACERLLETPMTFPSALVTVIKIPSVEEFADAAEMTTRVLLDRLFFIRRADQQQRQPQLQQPIRRPRSLVAPSGSSVD